MEQTEKYIRDVYVQQFLHNHIETVNNRSTVVKVKNGFSRMNKTLKLLQSIFVTYFYHFGTDTAQSQNICA